MEPFPIVLGTILICEAYLSIWYLVYIGQGHRGRDHIYNVTKFVSDLRYVDGFHRVLRFPPPIKLTPTI